MTIDNRPTGAATRYSVAARMMIGAAVAGIAGMLAGQHIHIPGTERCNGFL